MSKTKKQVFIILAAVAAFLILAAVILSNFIAVSFPDLDSMGCLTVVFDKADLEKADKVVLRKGDESYTIIDQELIHEITEQTITAKLADIQFEETNYWIEIYRGDKLLRQMNRGSSFVRVYEADVSHWMLMCHYGEGYVELPKNLENKLDAICDTVGMMYN